MWLGELDGLFPATLCPLCWPQWVHRRGMDVCLTVATLYFYVASLERRRIKMFRDQPSASRWNLTKYSRLKGICFHRAPPKEQYSTNFHGTLPTHCSLSSQKGGRVEGALESRKPGLKTQPTSLTTRSIMSNWLTSELVSSFCCPPGRWWRQACTMSESPLSPVPSTVPDPRERLSH